MELDIEVSVDWISLLNVLPLSLLLTAEKIPLPKIFSSTLRSRRRFGFNCSFCECLLFLDFAEDLALDEFLLALLNFKTENLELNGELS